MPARRPGEGVGAWRRYYLKWSRMTLEAIGADQVELVGSLARFCPPARVADKHVYSPWVSGDFVRQVSGFDTLVITGGETDICVAATVMGAIDRGSGSCWWRMRSAAQLTTPMTLP
ncbi:cysteine hydrolase family protein [Aminobacter anthyllidis]|uniref:cysteine hydrolase family protein n=1 Tax=Aminobacter anthyllidis TaxID=1035067 RepID=UPI003B75C5C8